MFVSTSGVYLPRDGSRGRTAVEQSLPLRWSPVEFRCATQVVLDQA
jgi:hypothetical protein